MQQDVKVVELVLPGPKAPAAPQPTDAATSWWIAGVVGVVLIANAGFVWWRVRGRDPLQRAFTEASFRAGLTRTEQRRVRELAGQAPPVALLISESALNRAAPDDDPIVVTVRQKLRRARA